MQTNGTAEEMLWKKSKSSDEGKSFSQKNEKYKFKENAWLDLFISFISTW